MKTTMTKKDVYDIIVDFVETIENDDYAGVDHFYNFTSLDDPHYGEDYLEQKEKFFEILKKALDITV